MAKAKKLVRDRIPENIIAQGEQPVFYAANDAEYWERLKEKLSEEVLEFQKAENPEELADILEVIDAIIEFKNFDKSELDEIKQKKMEAKGGFKKRIILEI